jgi:hypothetical protein
MVVLHGSRTTVAYSAQILVVENRVPLAGGKLIASFFLVVAIAILAGTDLVLVHMVTFLKKWMP